jgi:hypothetical protein
MTPRYTVRFVLHLCLLVFSPRHQTASHSKDVNDFASLDGSQLEASFLDRSAFEAWTDADEVNGQMQDARGLWGEAGCRLQDANEVSCMDRQLLEQRNPPPRPLSGHLECVNRSEGISVDIMS